ncbi:MAG: hypothetical protein GY738_21305 [Pseudoalteromonas sp.]|nr:hypothetical protein [Pseudoalteromonas sp.]
MSSRQVFFDSRGVDISQADSRSATFALNLPYHLTCSEVQLTDLSIRGLSVVDQTIYVSLKGVENSVVNSHFAPIIGTFIAPSDKNRLVQVVGVTHPVRVADGFNSFKQLQVQLIAADKTTLTSLLQDNFQFALSIVFK